MTAQLEHAPAVQTVPAGLITKRHSWGNVIFKEIDEARIPAAQKAAADLQGKLEYGEWLTDCQPVIYRETFRGEVITGALVIRCTVAGSTGEAKRNIWINGDHREGLQESTISFAGMIANEGARVDDIWEVTHLTEHSAQFGLTPGREAFPLASVSLIRPQGEEFSGVPLPRTGTEG